ncbi:hypothetical protein M438DRAFT_13897 [Aureobasidium pullulans EXF-150]|uniref:Uncharacterized protein n=1 Tax=Aureobasidium pullulans EXF-150 TaxID=1043002 RepID=A0A074Y1F6_AURPU|nr:uncharacterized protein M438DRAFT_13897 [Aureobasidium pullulans EXF-150]KEQ89764.1 hypothetical protein M438DRAFT_13897 [Aureobasidium pullulans EXF-150]
MVVFSDDDTRGHCYPNAPAKQWIEQQSSTENSGPDGCLMSANQKRCKTYSSRDSHVVTHRSTNLPFNCLCMAERTGCPVFS